MLNSSFTCWIVAVNFLISISSPSRRPVNSVKRLCMALISSILRAWISCNEQWHSSRERLYPDLLKWTILYLPNEINQECSNFKQHFLYGAPFKFDFVLELLYQVSPYFTLYARFCRLRKLPSVIEFERVLHEISWRRLN